MPLTYSSVNCLRRWKSKRNGFNRCCINFFLVFIRIGICFWYPFAFILDVIFCGSCGAKQKIKYAGGKEQREGTDTNNTTVSDGSEDKSRRRDDYDVESGRSQKGKGKR